MVLRFSTCRNRSTRASLAARSSESMENPGNRFRAYDSSGHSARNLEDPAFLIQSFFRAEQLIHANFEDSCRDRFVKLFRFLIVRTSCRKSLMPDISMLKSRIRLSADANVFVPGVKSHHIVERDLESPPVTISFLGPGRLNSPTGVQASNGQGFLELWFSDRHPEMCPFMPKMLREYLQPTWQGIEIDKISPMSLLPDVCTSGFAPVPRLFTESDGLESSFFICRTTSGKWTLFDSDAIRDPSRGCRTPPTRVSSLVQRLNALANVSAAACLVFDEGETVPRLVDFDFVREVVIIHDIEVRGVPVEHVLQAQGAVKIAGMYQGSLLMSVGNDIHILRPSGAWSTLSNAISSHTITKRIPVSIQSLANVIDQSGNLFVLRQGALMCFSESNSGTVAHNPGNICYVSLTYDPASDVMVLLGFDTREGNNTRYITLFDVKGKFAISTTAIADTENCSIVSIGVDPITSDIFILEKTSAFARLGVVCYSIPALYR